MQSKLAQGNIRVVNTYGSEGFQADGQREPILVAGPGGGHIPEGPSLRNDVSALATFPGAGSHIRVVDPHGNAVSGFPRARGESREFFLFLTVSQAGPRLCQCPKMQSIFKFNLKQPVPSTVCFGLDIRTGSLSD